MVHTRRRVLSLKRQRKAPQADTASISTPSAIESADSWCSNISEAAGGSQKNNESDSTAHRTPSVHADAADAALQPSHANYSPKRTKSVPTHARLPLQAIAHGAGVHTAASHSSRVEQGAPSSSENGDAAAENSDHHAAAAHNSTNGTLRMPRGSSSSCVGSLSACRQALLVAKDTVLQQPDSADGKPLRLCPAVLCTRTVCAHAHTCTHTHARARICVPPCSYTVCVEGPLSSA